MPQYFQSEARTDSRLSQWLVVIPARLASTRLPRKPLADLGGLPLVVRVYENLKPLAAAGAEVLVATDAEEVLAVLRKHQVPGVMTRVEHQSGTDRAIEVATPRKQPFILNVQGDEPEVNTDDLFNLCDSMNRQPNADMGTLVFPIREPNLVKDPNVVKAVRRHDGFALYFSRAPLPFHRDVPHHLPTEALQHIGVYAYRRERLLEFAGLPDSPLEASEKLEQLRALEAGWQIYLSPASRASTGIDTPHDLEVARAKYR